MKNKQTALEFSEQLIKGKIAEMIFAQMFRSGNKFTVIPFGYENTFPELAQYGYLAEDKQVFETIRNAPDFALVSHDKKEAYLIEVKYRYHVTSIQLLEEAQKIQSKWKAVKLFLATPEGFYLSGCDYIIEKYGQIEPLKIDWVEEKIQIEYLELLKGFINKP